MVVHVKSLAFNGIEIIDVDVQIQVSTGVPGFVIVGLADKTIAESKERVRAALSAIGLALPAKKILINLSPADLVKEGSHFDLPIACGLLASMDVLPKDIVCSYLILGELSLDGSILPVNGALPAAIGALARNKGLICPKGNGSEAAWSSNESIIAPSNLLEIVNHFKGSQVLSPPEIKLSDSTQDQYADLRDIKGQKQAKRALEIAAAGGHHMLMVGPPGAGKSLLASRIPGILPYMTSQEILECSAIASVSGNIKNGALQSTRPFRSPHHTCSAASMVGGGIGRKVKPGEISLSHNGVLFLDELPEFSSDVIESLRQPIEVGEVTIARANYHVKYPANFQLIAAMNPCKCGYLGDERRECSKAPKCSSNYQMKISGPMLDRFDINIEVPNVSVEDYNYINNDDAESSAIVASRVLKARKIQAERYDGYNIALNSRLDGKLLIDYAIPIDDGKDLLNEAAKKFHFSMRGYNKILRVARTIADLDASFVVKKSHISEAINYRYMNFTNLLL